MSARGLLAGGVAGLAVFAGVVAPSLAADYTGADPAVKYTVPDSVPLGQDIHVSGTGWKIADGSAGSVIAFKLDDGSVSTTLTVTHPVTGAEQANKTIYGIVQADAAGAWSVDLPFPTSTNSTATWSIGQTHKVTMLTGSLASGDEIRSLSATFTVVDPAAQPPSWPAQTLSAPDGAAAWVGSSVDAGDGGQIRLKGFHWLDTAGTGPSVVAVKLSSSATQQYTRTGSDVVLSDPTIWAVVSPDADGSFETVLDAPDGLVAGQYLTVSLLSGKFATGDQRRSLVSQPLVVGGVPYRPDDPTGGVTCATDRAAATVTAKVTADSLGGTVHVTGAGWCHPGAGQGGSTVAIKIDDGAYSHLDSTVSSNRTVWAILQAADRDGTFSADVHLPDGSSSGSRGSDPAFTTGGHSLTFLSGSLKPGDTGRSVTVDFVIGAYRPSGIPAPLEFHEDLTAARAGGLVAAVRSGRLAVSGLPARAWTYLSVYGSDGAPRTPWGETWFRADAAGRVSAPLSGVVLPDGRSKLVAQSGEQGAVGTLQGWTWIGTAAVTASPSASASTAPPAPLPPVVVTVAPPSSAASSPVVTPTVPATPTASVRPVAPAVAAVAPVAVAPLTRPAPPFADDTGLTDANAGQIAALQNGDVVTLTVGGARPGQWVYVYAYSSPTPVGWVQLDAGRQVRVDVGGLPFGTHKLAVLSPAGRLLGWAPATGTAAAEVVAPAAEPVAAPVAATRVRSAGVGAGWWAGGAALAVLIGGAAGAGLSRRKVNV